MNPNEQSLLSRSRTRCRGRCLISLRDLWNQLLNPKRSLPDSPPELSERDLNGVPDLLQPLEGWRVWKIVTAPSLRQELPLLRSVILDTPWTPRRKVAAEHSFDLGAKCQGLLKSSCSCGMYAFKSPADAFNYLSGVRDRLLGMSVDAALGTVSLWGKVVECERGYRAQYAYPRHIYLPATACHRVREVTAAFGVPVGVYASLGRGEIRAAESFEYVDQWRKTLALRKSRVLETKNTPYKIGFYDRQIRSNSPASAP